MIGKYIIGGVRDFSLTTYMKAIKVKYGTWELFIRDNDVNWTVDPNGALIKEQWNDIEPLTAREAFEEENQEKRRVLFSYLGPAKLFAEVKPELVDRTVLKLKNLTWDDNNKPVKVPIEDVYELYQIRESELFPIPREGDGVFSSGIFIKVVRCWCTTTGREYWIFVQDSTWNQKTQFKNAIQAIAWTFRVGIKKEDILELYRQGDCMMIKAKSGAKVLEEPYWYHLDEETYRNKLVAQS